MAGQWAPDPYGRAELRYHDGLQWTSRVSDNGVPRDEPAQPADPPMMVPQQAAASGNSWLPPASAVPPFHGSYAPPTRGKDGKLLAAGILGIISGAIATLVSLSLFSAANDDSVGEWIDDVSGNMITILAVIALITGGGYLAAGIGGLVGKQWGRITLITVSSVFIALTLLGMLSDTDEAASGLVSLAWCGTIIGLAAAGKPSS